MPARRRADGVLELGGVALVVLARDPRIGTPAYVYDLDAVAAEARELDASFEGAPHLVAYAVKANSAGPIVKTLVERGCGIDVVSGAELRLALRCGVAPSKILYSGVAKTDDELDLAITLGAEGIGAIQVESVEEAARVAARASTHGRVARVSVRINPGVEAEAIDTHSYISTGHDEAKFGVPLASVGEALEQLSRTSSAKIVGLSSHVGSQFTSTDAYLAAARSLFSVAKQVRARTALAFVDTGGGFGIDYGEGCPVRPADFIRATRRLQKESGLDDLALYCEPGRALVAAHAVLLARVIQRKIAPPTAASPERRWTMIDAGMNDLMRPALYQARHRVVPLEATSDAKTRPYRVVGPVCESSDDFGVHDLTDDAREVAILDAGGYGYSMASRYNGRPLPAEVFLKGGKVDGFSARAPLDAWVEDRLRAGGS
jgi:diaminopimelate decarboxylase